MPQQANIQFDEKFAALLASEEEPVVTITPIGNCNGIHLLSVSKTGFVVEENNSGNSNVAFTWIAMGKRTDNNTATMPTDLADKNFDENLKGFTFNEGNTEQSAKPMWWDGNKIRFDENMEAKSKDAERLAKKKANAKTEEIHNGPVKAVQNQKSEAEPLPIDPAKTKSTQSNK